MTEPDDTGGNHTDDTSERIVNRRGVLKLFGAATAVGSVAYLGQLGGADDSSVPNWLEYALSSRVEWAVDTSFTSRPTVADGTLYIRKGNWTHALATADGAEQWRVKTGDDYASFGFPTTVAGGVVYEFLDRDQLYAFDAADGSERWTADLGDYAPGPPTVAGDTVYFGCDDTMYALDPTDGSTRWSVEMPDINGSPVVTDDTVYVGGNGTVYALDTADGAERWSAAVDDAYIVVSTQAGDTLYAIGSGGIYALDGADGAERWRVESLRFQTVRRTVRGGLAIAGDSVYATEATGPLYKIDSDGNAQAQFQVEGRLATPPVVADGTVYVAGGTDSRLYAVDTAEGTERWSFPVGGFYHPVVADGTVYVTSSGSLYALTA